MQSNRFRNWIVTFSAIVAMTIAIPAQAVIISAVNNNSNDAGDVYNVVTGGLANGVEAFIDRNHEYENLPAYLIGADYVQTANDDKTAGPGFSVDLTTGPQSADIYLFVDNRIGSVMSWVGLLGFVDTLDDIGIDESADGDIDQTSSVYKLSNVSAGTTIFLEQNAGRSRNMYGIAAVAIPDSAVPEPATASLGLLAIGAIAMRRRRMN